MKSIGLPKLAALLMITFAITFLNFEDLSFETNLKSYILLIAGVAILIYSFFASKRSSKKIKE